MECDKAMGFHQEHILPHLINLAMRNRRLIAYRERVISGAEGRVLEIGIGSGLNLPLYSRNVRRIIGLDPSPRLLAMARRTARPASGLIEFIEGSAEEIPLENATVDTVVTTWTLCSIPDAPRALREMRRVLRPAGRLLFVEHGRAPDPSVVWWQDRLEHQTSAASWSGTNCISRRSAKPSPNTASGALTWAIRLRAVGSYIFSSATPWGAWTTRSTR